MSDNIPTSSIMDLHLERDSFIALCSKRKTGKSYMMAEILYYFLTDEENKVDFVYLFSETAGLKSGTNSQYDFLDRKCILPAKPEIIQKIIHGLFASQNASGFKYHVLVAFDDIDMGSRFEIIEKLATLGRHYKITTILSAQIANTAVSPQIRNNISYLFWRRLNKNAVRDNIFPVVGGSVIEDSNALWELTQKSIADYHFLFYDNNTDDSADSLKIVKAQPIPDDFKYELVTQAERQEQASQQRVRKFDPYSRSESLVRPARLWGEHKYAPKDNPY